MFSCRQNAFLLSPDSRQERTTCSICSSVCFMITVFHKAKHKLPSCKDVLARVLTKLLLWERDGFSIFHKRLERGTYELPSSVSAGLRSDELMLILQGISLKSVRRRKRFLLTKNNFQSSNITGFING